MRIGILGGTFDPVHYGHLLLAETCRQTLSLDRICLVPARMPPHKQGQTITDGNARAEMLELAVSGYPEFKVDRRELRREGPSFTVETLAEFRAEFSGAELFFLMGVDSLKDVPSWRDPEQIVELAQLVACNRPGFASPTPDQVADWVTPTIALRTTIVRIPGADLSSTGMRQRMRDGLGLRFSTPRAVEAYIDQHGLYRR
jgi:nicotinate-nucleotide adenylyltransferase